MISRQVPGSIPDQKPERQLIDFTRELKTNDQFKKQRNRLDRERRISRSLDDMINFCIEENPKPKKPWGNLKKSKSVCIRKNNLSDKERLQELLRKHRATISPAEIILNCEEFEKKNSNVPTRPKPSKFPASSKTDDDIVQLRRTETSSIRKEHAQTIHETSKSSNVQEPLTAKGPYKLKIDNVTIKKNGKVEVRQRQVFFWDNEYLFRSDLIESDLEIDKYQISYRTKEGIRTVTFKNPIRNHDSISAESRSFLKKFLRRRSDKHLLEKKGILKNENVFGNKLPVLKELFGGNAVPPFVRKIMMLIEHEDNVKTEYIYRISGNMAVIQKIRLQIDENNIGILDKHVKDVEVLTGTLKLFYRELVDPVLPHKDFEQLNKILENVKDPKERSNQVMNVINQIESPNRENLKELIEHLLRIEAKCSSNKMTLKSLAIVWGPSLIWYPLDKYPDEGCKAVNFSLLVNDVVEMMFTSYKLFLSSKEEQRVNQNQNQQQLTTSTSVS